MSGLIILYFSYSSFVVLQVSADESGTEPLVYNRLPHRHVLGQHVYRSHGNADHAQLEAATCHAPRGPVPGCALPVSGVVTRHAPAHDHQPQRHHHRRHRRHRVRRVQWHGTRDTHHLVVGGASIVSYLLLN